MGTNEVQIFIHSYMRQVFDGADIELGMFYDICALQYKGLLKISCGDFKESFDILFDDYHLEKQIVDFCNQVVRDVNLAYSDYITKEK